MSFALAHAVAFAWCLKGDQTPSVMTLLDRVVEAGDMAPLPWPLGFQMP